MKLAPKLVIYGIRRFAPGRRESGQALVFGLFILSGALAALFFIFNTGQLIGEKNKLVNTADAVAYSAGVMHARALNFDAYTNRALMANEVMIAQAVSIASWTKHVLTHTENVPPLACYNGTSVPIVLGLIEYVPVCYLLSTAAAGPAAQMTDQVVQAAARSTLMLSGTAQKALQGAQAVMAATFVPVRQTVMQQVADANYVNDGTVQVGAIPLTDNYMQFEGKPFIGSYSGTERQRLKDTVLTAAYMDGFIRRRSWSSASPWPCIVAPRGEYRKRGGTELMGLDEWRSIDTASVHYWHPRWSLLGFRCKKDPEQALGYGTQAATDTGNHAGGTFGGVAENRVAASLASSANWNYRGLPNFYELSGAGLNYPASDPGLEQRGPTLKFAVRLTRAKNQLRTSDGTAQIHTAGKIAQYQSVLASDRMTAVATSEVYFQRPEGRADGKVELASLFNPYWQVHLIVNSTGDMAAALAP